MGRARHLSVTPGTAIALVALFFALGGSAFAVGERIQSPSVAQQRCANGAVRGVATVTGNPSQGMANIPDRFTSANNLFSRKFNCTGKAVQVRRVRERRLRSAVRRDRRARAQSERCRYDASATVTNGAGAFRVAFRTSAGRPGRPRVHARRRVATESAARRTRRFLLREQEHARDREEEPRDLALAGLAAQPRAQVVVRLRQRVCSARLRELASRRLRDRAQRLRIGRHRNDLARVLRGAAERPALDDAVRGSQCDRVDGEARLLGQLGSFERLEKAARLGAVGQEENRDGALLLVLVAARPPARATWWSSTSPERLSRRPRARGRSPAVRAGRPSGVRRRSRYRRRRGTRQCP